MLISYTQNTKNNNYTLNTNNRSQSEEVPVCRAPAPPRGRRQREGCEKC